MLVLVLFLLLVRYQYSRYQKGKIFSLFQITDTLFDQKVCGISRDDLAFGFNSKYSNSVSFYNVIKVKGVLVGIKKDENSNRLVIKVPGLLFPKYYLIDAGDARWYVDLDYYDPLKQEADTGGGDINTVASDLIAACPLTLDVLLYRQSEVNCSLLEKGQKQCNYVMEAFNRNPDTEIFNTVYFSKNESKANLYRQKLQLFIRSRFYFGQVIGVTV